MTEYEPSLLTSLISLLFLGIILSSILIWSQKKHRNPLDLGQNNSRVPNWDIPWIDFLLFIFSAFLLIILAQNLLALWLPDLPEGEELELTPQIALLSILSLQGPILLNFILFQKFYLKENAIQLNLVPVNVAQDLKHSLILFAQFLPVIWLLSIIWSSFLRLLQHFSLIEAFPIQPLVELLAKDMPILNFLMIALLGIALAPLVEEIIFRGCLYRFLKSRHSILVAQLVSAVLFALLHDNLNSFLPLVFIGFILVRIYESTGSIYKAIYFHAFFNASSFIFMGLLKYSGLPLEVIFP
ncbi:MAG: type II CAAX endopeptidase family protein [Opitutae bacterium]|jgi:membrane protease YdiL (CAAX protease family)|nr:type II CAAX endopeptidase family protein [Opitutae bacterium]